MVNDVLRGDKKEKESYITSEQVFFVSRVTLKRVKALTCARTIVVAVGAVEG